MLVDWTITIAIQTNIAIQRDTTLFQTEISYASGILYRFSWSPDGEAH